MKVAKVLYQYYELLLIHCVDSWGLLLPVGVFKSTKGSLRNLYT
jgi:hypothetical protein